LSVRPARLDDFEPLLSLLLYHDDILRDHYGGEVDASSMRADLDLYFHSDSAIVFIAEHDGRLSGAIVCFTFVKPVTGNLTCCEVYWVVRKDFPSQGLALKRAAEREARRRGAVSMMISAPDDRVKKMLAASGYRPTTTVFERFF
jgi:hypothetical protein